jgi:hypothetical protein
MIAGTGKGEKRGRVVKCTTLLKPSSASSSPSSFSPFLSSSPNIRVSPSYIEKRKWTKKGFGI